jgi:toxin ParE1/3/4
MPRYELSDRARDDLTDIFEYIAADNEHSALRTVMQFLDLCARLQEFPKLGRSRDELQDGLCSFPQGNFIVFYRIRAGQVIVLRVLHAARDLNDLFS